VLVREGGEGKEQGEGSKGRRGGTYKRHSVKTGPIKSTLQAIYLHSDEQNTYWEVSRPRSVLAAKINCHVPA